jgi:lysophospholipase L1-like esterase
LSASTDGITFEKIAEGTWDGAEKKLQTIALASQTKYRAVMLTAITASDNTAAASEIEVYTTDSKVFSVYQELLDTITSARTTLITAKVGIEFGAESQKIRNDLAAAIEAAQAAADDRTATTEQDTEAIDNLKKSVQAFNALRLQQAIKDANKVLEKASLDSNELKNLTAAVQEAEKVISDSTASFKSVETVLSGLIQKNVAADPSAKWIGAWAASAQGPFGGDSEGFNNQTLRMIVYPKAEGSHIRLRFSNVFGSKPLTIGKFVVAQQENAAYTAAGSNRIVTFNGDTTVTIPAGSEAFSDPAAFEVTGSPIAVSVYVPESTGYTTWHRLSNQTIHVSYGGDHTEADGSKYTHRLDHWYWLTGVDVLTYDEKARVIAVIGDSITDGSGSTLNANHRWTDFLDQRLKEKYPHMNFSVLNAGISGNKLLRDSGSQGPSALSRFDRDVLSQSGVTDVIIFEGINDIGHTPHTLDHNKIIEAMESLASLARERGLRVYAGTLTPFRGFAEDYFTEEGGGYKTEGQ